MAQGVGFSIDASFLNKIEQADKALKKLADTNDTVVKNISNTWKQIGEQGLDSYLRSLEKQKNVLADIASIKFDDSAPYYLKKFGENARSSVAEIDKLIQTLTTLQKATPKQQAIEKARQEAYDIVARADAKTGGKDWSLTGEVALREYQAQLEAMRRYVAERKAMYAQMFDEIDAKERKQQTDYSNYRQQQLKDELTQYRKNKEAQAAIDKRNHDRRQRELEEIFRLQAQHEERLRKRQQSIYNATGDSSQGALAYADRLFRGAKPMTLNNMQTALSKLQDAQRKLNLDTDAGKKKYEQLAAMIRRVQQRINEATGASNQLRNSHNSLINTGDQLMRKFALIFSVSQIQGYINKLVQVRGEFELQQRALQAILQNKDEANKIWQQTVDLAVRSPFRVKELVTYTKQLAAYRIETDQLHETTKRLADVSAGLGVDMNRLILAYGQVRAAEYLRGTELRQFTEAGIPLLEELAERFTALRGETVSTAEVFGMISKRMVSFEDVAAVFQKMTDAGGVFYNMQEIQAETLKGQISNLHDSIDLMLNDIGKANEGTLKGGVQVAKYFVDNWESVVVVIKGVIAALIGLKLHQLATQKVTIQTALSMGVVTNASTKQLTALQLLQVGWNKLTGAVAGAGATMKSVIAFNLPLLAITAIIGGIVELISTFNQHQDQIKEINKKYDELASKANKVTVNFGNAVRNKDFDKQKEALMQLVKIANNDYNMGIDIELRGLSEEEVESKFTNLRNQLQQMKTFRQEFSTKLQEATEGTLQDDIQEDLAQYGSAATQLMNKMFNNSADIIVELRKNFDSLTESEQAALTELEKPRDINESELKYLERIQSAYTTLMGKYQRYYDQYEKTRVTGNHHEVLSLLVAEDKRLASMGINAKALAGYFSEYNNKLIEAKNEIEKFYDTVDINKSLSVEEKTLQIKTAIDEQGWNSFTTELAYRLANEKWKVNIGFSLKDPNALDHWQNEYNKFVEGFSTQVTRANKKSDRFNLAKQLSDLWQDKNKVIKAYKNGAKEITKTEYESAKKIADELNKSHIWLIGEAIKEKGKKNGKGKDWWLEMIKGIQSLHKEFLALNKDLNDVKAKQLAIKKHSGMFDEIKQHLGAAGNAIDINTIDFANENAFVKFLEGLKEIPNLSAQAKLAIEKALTDIKGEAEVRFEVENTERIKREIADMFGNYEMSLELEKLNIPPDLAKQLFGVESLDLSSLRNKILDKAGLSSLKGKSNEEIYDSGAFKKLSEERQKAIKDGLEKEEELERKAQEERLKKYVKYLQKAQDARVKIKLEELRQIDEVEKESRFTKDQKKEIKEALQKESKQAIDKQTWEDFTGSAFYIEIFRDLENTSTEAIKVMRERLLALKDSLGDQSPEQLKAMVEQLEKMDDELAKRQNPFKQLSGNLKEYFEYLKKSKQLNEDFKDSQDKIRRAELQRDSQSNEVAEAEQRWKAEVKISGANSEQARFLQQEYIVKKGLLDQTLKQLVAEGKISEELARQIREGQTAGNKAGQNIQTIGSYFKEFGSGVTEIAGNLENVFGSMSDSMRDTAESIAEIANGVGNTVSGIGRVVANPADIGGYIQALGGLTSAIGAIFNTRDKSLERQIQNNIKMVEQLERAYQRLEKRIEDAYSVGNIQTNYELAKKNLIQQQEAYANMIEMEEAKKKTDKDKIREWKNELEDLTQQRQELEEQRLADLGGFGSQANYKSAAEEFANAWFDAYQEVGDGMGALEDTFDDFINNVVKKQLLIKGSNKLLQPVLDMIDKAVSDGEVTTQEMAEVNRKWNEDTKDALNSYYKSIYDMYDGLINGAGELSDLQRGIQNITEPQAAAIEAYLNSLRFFVSDSNRVLKEIQQQMSVGVNNPMVSELKAQTQLIRTIDENLSSVIGRGSSSHTGAYIKVLAK